MRKDSHSAFFDLNSKLQKRLDELEEINYDICQCTQGFATLNSNILSFYDQLKQIVKDENNLFIQTAHTNIKNEDKNELIANYARVFKTKDEILENYNHLSQNLANFISLFACKTLCDEYTTSKVQEIRAKFFKISEMKKDINYRIKFNHQNQIIPNKISSPIVVKFNMVKTKLDPSNFIQKISDGSIYNTENLESLNKFYVSLEPIRDRLLDMLSSLIATQDDSKIYQLHPSPKMLGSYPKFNKYIKIYAKLKNAFDTQLSQLRPYYDKIQRKQQQIDTLVSDLTNLSSKMYKTLKCLEAETERYTNIECLYRKISVIDNSHKSYQFFEPELYTSFILKFVDEEKKFLKDIDKCIKYSKSQSNSSSISTSSSTASVVVNDNLESLSSINHQQELLDLFTSFYNSISKSINRFEEKNIFFQLEDKLKKKKKLEIDFPTKYPRADSAPKQTLLMERKHFEETTKSVNCAFECINTDIEQTISDLSKIEAASSSFSSFHNFLKTESSHFEDFFFVPASYQWSLQVSDEFKTSIKNKEDEIKKIKLKLELEKKLKDCASCCHPKTICLTSCGHTFCDSCLILENVSVDSPGICPKCLKEFYPSDLIRIKW